MIILKLNISLFLLEVILERKFKIMESYEVTLDGKTYPGTLTLVTKNFMRLRSDQLERDKSLKIWSVHIT